MEISIVCCDSISKLLVGVAFCMTRKGGRLLYESLCVCFEATTYLRETWRGKNVERWEGGKF